MATLLPQYNRGKVDKHLRHRHALDNLQTITPVPSLAKVIIILLQKLRSQPLLYASIWLLVSFYYWLIFTFFGGKFFVFRFRKSSMRLTNGWQITNLAKGQNSFAFFSLAQPSFVARETRPFKNTWTFCINKQLQKIIKNTKVKIWTSMVRLLSGVMAKLSRLFLL